MYRCFGAFFLFGRPDRGNTERWQTLQASFVNLDFCSQGHGDSTTAHDVANQGAWGGRAMSLDLLSRCININCLGLNGSEKLQNGSICRLVAAKSCKMAPSVVVVAKSCQMSLFVGMLWPKKWQKSLLLGPLWRKTGHAVPKAAKMSLFQGRSGQKLPKLAAASPRIELRRISSNFVEFRRFEFQTPIFIGLREIHRPNSVEFRRISSKRSGTYEFTAIGSGRGVFLGNLSLESTGLDQNLSTRSRKAPNTPERDFLNQLLGL